MSEARKNFGERFAGQLPRSCRNQIDLRMREKKAHQLFAGVPGSTHDRHFGFRHKAMRISSRADCNELSCYD
jgi:hypothetical protein